MTTINNVPIFTKRFAPKKITGMVLLPRLKKILLDNNNEPKLLNHLILVGSPGLGKTTFLDFIADLYPTLKVNASFYSSVDDLKTEILDFCRTTSGVFDNYPRNEYKVVYLDELDGVSKQYQDALKGFIEEYEDRVRFVASCNNPSKISDALLDERFILVNFNAINEEEKKYLIEGYTARLTAIAKKVEASENIINEIPNIVKKSFPSMRRCLKKLELTIATGITEEKSNSNYVSTKELDIFKAIISPNIGTETIWNMIIEFWMENPESLAVLCGKDFPEWIFTNMQELVYIIPETLTASVNCQKELALERIDPLVSLANMIFKIKTTIKNK